jgi:hypothetical protein
MDTKSFKKKVDESSEEVNQEVKTEVKKEVITDNELNNLGKEMLSKDEEIRQLKLKLAEAQQVNKLKKGDIRAEVNRLGDPKRICIGVDSFGRRLWKDANRLTDADIESRENYVKSIKQQNAKKYN